MDEKFIQALGGAVDSRFADILRQSVKAQQTKPVQPPPRRRKTKSRSPRRSIRGGGITWIEHVRLTAGSTMCWKQAMREASKTWK